MKIPLSTRRGQPARSWLLAVTALFLALLAANGASRLHQTQAAPPALPLETQNGVSLGQRSFYVTLSNVNGDQALNSCAEGYHMASLYELHDPTALTYALGEPTAKTLADQGTGPVAGWWGWVRTGGVASTTNAAGQANCDLWTSAVAGEYGTLVRLSQDWTAPATAISPWQAQTWSCSGLAPVWCISDPRWGQFLPGIFGG